MGKSQVHQRKPDGSDCRANQPNCQQNWQMRRCGHRRFAIDRPCTGSPGLHTSHLPGQDGFRLPGGRKVHHAALRRQGKGE